MSMQIDCSAVLLIHRIFQIWLIKPHRNLNRIGLMILTIPMTTIKPYWKKSILLIPSRDTRKACLKKADIIDLTKTLKISGWIAIRKLPRKKIKNFMTICSRGAQLNYAVYKCPNSICISLSLVLISSINLSEALNIIIHILDQYIIKQFTRNPIAVSNKRFLCDL